MVFNLDLGAPSQLTLVLTHLTDYIRNQTSVGNYTGMILIDLQKAFATVDHAILSGVAGGGGAGGQQPPGRNAASPLAPQMKLHFVQRSMESRHFESQSAPLLTPEPPPCRPLILKCLATPLAILFKKKKWRPLVFLLLTGLHHICAVGYKLLMLTRSIPLHATYHVVSPRVVSWVHFYFCVM